MKQEPLKGKIIMNVTEAIEENTERYGDCCEVNYELIEKDKQKELREQKIQLTKEISERLTKLEIENRELKAQLKW